MREPSSQGERRAGRSLGRGLAALGWLALAAGAALGTWWEDAPVQAEVRRAGYRVLAGDFHVHTRFSDGFLSPLEVVLVARRHGLDVLAVTEHNMTFPAKMARWFSEQLDGPVVIVGEEITSRAQHVLALGIDEAIPGDTPLPLALARVHEQGGLAFGAHPVKRFHAAFERVAAELDGLEVVHPIALRSRSRGMSAGTSTTAGPDPRLRAAEGGASPAWRWEEMIDLYRAFGRTGRRVSAIGTSDYHFFAAMGVCRTFVFAEARSAESVLAALREGRTVVYGPDGRTFGDPALIAALEADPLPSALTAERSVYVATSARDALSRTCAWVGLVLIVLFGRPFFRR